MPSISSDFAMHLLEAGNFRMKKGLSPKSVNRICAVYINLFKHALIQDDIPKISKIYFKMKVRVG